MGWGDSQGVSRSNQVACVCLCACLRVCVHACIHPAGPTRSVCIALGSPLLSLSPTRVPVDMRRFLDSFHVHSVSHFPETGEDGSQFPFLLLPREKGQAFFSLSHFFFISPSPEPAGWGRG